MIGKTTFAMIALSVVAILGWGLWLSLLIGTGVRETTTISSPRTLRYWRETCDAVLDGFGSCTSAVSATQQTWPQTFEMSSILLNEDGREVIVLYAHRFGVELDSRAKILLSINATAPIDFQLLFSNQTDVDVLAFSHAVASPNRVIIDAQQIISYYHELIVQEKGLYIFVFDVMQPKPVATVTFDIS